MERIGKFNLFCIINTKLISLQFIAVIRTQGTHNPKLPSNESDRVDRRKANEIII